MRYLASILPHPADELISTQPLGALYTPQHTVFRVWAPTASAISLHLYQAPLGGQATIVELSPQADGSWEATLPGDWLGAYYTYTAAGADPRFNPQRELLDPYAQAVTAHDGRAIVVHDTTPVAERPSFPMAEAIIYELHLRDFTLDPDSGVQRRGKYLGLTEIGTHLTNRPDITTGLDHLLELGVNTVQLLPIGEFCSDAAHDQYAWGYDAVQHFSPDGWYASEGFDARRVREVKQMIDTLHQHGLRVTLDVVFNHTAEGDHRGRTLSFRGIDNKVYYMLAPDGSYFNFSGCGNTVNCNHPVVRQMVKQCLQYWVAEYHIDGFRFDLASVLGRSQDGNPLSNPPLLESLSYDPILAKVKLIAEAWDAGGLYQVGSFPGYGRWAEWNGKYRDDVRCFLKSDPGMVGKMALRVQGSPDLYEFRSNSASINFITCHDGFTLNDQFSYNTKHNDPYKVHHHPNYHPWSLVDDERIRELAQSAR